MRTLVLFSLLTACTPHAYSPPARTIPLEAPASIGLGRTGVQVEGGLGTIVFGASYVHASARVRHGVQEQTDISVEGSFVHFLDTGDDLEGASHLGIYSGRFGVKHAFSPHVAVATGIGGGGSAGGAFISPDVALILGYENPYCVPFVSGRLAVSIPVAPREVVLEASSMPIVGTPDVTGSFALISGMRIPLARDDINAGALSVGMAWVQMWDRQQANAFFSAQLGLELHFGDAP